MHFSLETPKSKKENAAGSSVTSLSLSTFFSRVVLAFRADVNRSHITVPPSPANISGSAHPVAFLWGCHSTELAVACALPPQIWFWSHLPVILQMRTPNMGLSADKLLQPDNATRRSVNNGNLLHLSNAQCLHCLPKNNNWKDQFSIFKPVCCQNRMGKHTKKGMF